METDDGVDVTRLVLNDKHVLLQTDDASVTEAAYTLNPQPYGHVISRREPAAESLFHHFDGRHNTAGLSDEVAAVAGEYQYDAFGKLLQGDPSATPHLYKGEVGYHHDADLDTGEGTYLAHNRVVTGPRFLSEDPAEDDPNTYRHVRNNPLNESDPSGLQAGTVVLGRAEKLADEIYDKLDFGDERPKQILVEELRRVERFKRPEDGLAPTPTATSNRGLLQLKQEYKVGFDAARQFAVKTITESDDPALDVLIAGGDPLQVGTVRQAVLAEIEESLRLAYLAPVPVKAAFADYEVTIDLRTGEVLNFRSDDSAALASRVRERRFVTEGQPTVGLFADGTVRGLRRTTPGPAVTSNGQPLISAHITGYLNHQDAEALTPTALDVEATARQIRYERFGSAVTEGAVLGEFSVVLASFLPGVGEAMDLEVLLSKAPWWAKVLAGVSLLVSVVTAGTSPNFGALGRRARRGLKGVAPTRRVLSSGTSSHGERLLEGGVDAAQDHFDDMLTRMFRDADAGDFQGIWLNREVPYTQFHDTDLAIYFRRQADVTGRVVGEEVQHAIDFTQGATLSRISREAASQGVARNEIVRWWHRRVFTRQLQNVHGNHHGMGVLQPYSDDIYRAYQNQGGRLSLEEILSQTFDGLY